MQTITMYKKDLLPALEVQVYDTLGRLVDLTNVDGIYFSAGEDGSNLIIADRPVTILDATKGLCQYTWQDGDTDTPGEYQGQIYLMYGGKAITALVFRFLVLDSLR